MSASLVDVVEHVEQTRTVIHSAIRLLSMLSVSWANIVMMLSVYFIDAQIDRRYARNLTLIHEYQPQFESEDLAEQDTGDLHGDMFFVLRSFLLPIACRNHDPEAHGLCDNPEQNGTLSNVVSEHLVEVDSRFGEYGACDAQQGVYKCQCGTFFRPVHCNSTVGQADVASRYNSRTPHFWDPNWKWWRVNLARKVGGKWYSTFRSGRCSASPEKPCYWREVKIVRRIASHCLLARVASAVVAHNASCFASCAEPSNMSSPCYAECFMKTVLGQRADSHLIGPGDGIPQRRLDDAWNSAFSSSDPASGGCPDAVTAADASASELGVINAQEGQRFAMYDLGPAGLNNYGGCFEGTSEYLHDCLFVSNFVGYFLMQHPTITTGSCADLGYARVGYHHIFTNATFYWSTSKSQGVTFQSWNSTFYTDHPLLDEKYIMAGNARCGHVSPRSGTMSALDGRFISIYDTVPAADMMMTVCISGTRIGMVECGIPSDPFAYIMMKKPVVTSTPCPAQFQFVTLDFRAGVFNQSWVNGSSGISVGGFSGSDAYFQNHSRMALLVSTAVSQNPHCLPAFCNTWKPWNEAGKADCDPSTPEYNTFRPEIRWPPHISSGATVVV